jgi:hypothetical protein
MLKRFFEIVASLHLSLSSVLANPVCSFVFPMVAVEEAVSPALSWILDLLLSLCPISLWSLSQHSSGRNRLLDWENTYRNAGPAQIASPGYRCFRLDEVPHEALLARLP